MTPTLVLSVTAISIGAAVGANLRWMLALALNALWPALPPGTLVANLLGAWLIGMALAVFALWAEPSPLIRLAVVTGFLGALTTFSTFSIEILEQLQAGRWAWAMAGIALHVGGSLLMTAAGLATVAGLRYLVVGLR